MIFFIIKFLVLKNKLNKLIKKILSEKRLFSWIFGASTKGNVLNCRAIFQLKYLNIDQIYC